MADKSFSSYKSIPKKSSPTDKTTATDATDSTAAEAEELVQSLQKREQENKKTLKRLRQLNDKVLKNRFVIQAKLKSVRQSNQNLKRENEAAEGEVKDMVKELQKLTQERQNEPTGAKEKKLFTEKGKLKADKNLSQAMADLLKHLEDTIVNEQTILEQTAGECEETERNLEDEEKNENDKSEQRHELVHNVNADKKTLEHLKKDIRNWLDNFYDAIGIQPEKLIEGPNEFEEAVERIHGIIDSCDDKDREYAKLNDRLAKLEDKADKYASKHLKDLAVRESLNELPEKWYSKIAAGVRYRETSSAPPPFVDVDAVTYLLSLYQWANNERQFFESDVNNAEGETTESTKISEALDKIKREELTNLDGILADLEDEANKLERENDKLREKLDDRTKSFAESGKTKTKTVNRLMIEARILSETKRSLTDVYLTTVEKSVEDETIATEQNEMAIQMLGRCKADLEDELARVESQIERFADREAENVEEEKRNLLQRLNELKNRKRALKNELHEMKADSKDVEQLRADVKTTNKRCATLGKTVEEKENQVKTVSDSMERLRDRNALAESKYENFHQRLNNLEKSNNRKQRRIDRQKQILHDLMKDLEEEETRTESEYQVPSWKMVESSKPVESPEEEKQLSERPRRAVEVEKGPKVERRECPTVTKPEKPAEFEEVERQKMYPEFGMAKTAPMVVIDPGKQYPQYAFAGEVKQKPTSIEDQPKSAVESKTAPETEVKSVERKVKIERRVKKKPAPQVDDSKLFQIKKVHSYLNKPSTFQQRSFQDEASVEMIGNLSPASQLAKKKKKKEMENMQ